MARLAALLAVAGLLVLACAKRAPARQARRGLRLFAWAPQARAPPGSSQDRPDRAALVLWGKLGSARMRVMRRAFATADDRLLAQLQAPPDLSEGIRSLTYWHERRRRLSWYRVRARREAMRMIIRWEHRVQDAMFSQPRAPITVRAAAGLLVTRTRLQRWSRRTLVVVTTLVGVSLLAAPFVAGLALLIHAL